MSKSGPTKVANSAQDAQRNQNSPLSVSTVISAFGSYFSSTPVSEPKKPEPRSFSPQYQSTQARERQEGWLTSAYNTLPEKPAFLGGKRKLKAD